MSDLYYMGVDTNSNWKTNGTITTYPGNGDTFWIHSDYDSVYELGNPTPIGIGVIGNSEKRKEVLKVNRQTFLDALGDEGKSITSEQRELIRDAKEDKWELLVARLLAKVFESTDLVVLKEKPKEVIVREG